MTDTTQNTETNTQTTPPPVAAAKEAEAPYEFPELIAELEKLYNEGLQHPTSQEGKLFTGKITKIEGNAVLVDLGESKQGQIQLSEFKGASPKEGDEVSALLEAQREQGPWLLSKQKADDLKRYEKTIEACEKNELVEGTIVARVKGGLSVDIGLRAFLPGSHVAEQFIENLDPFVGQKLQFKVIKLDPKKGSIVLSRKSLATKESDSKKKELFATLKEGEVRQGVVKSITDYGAFVDIGGADGLLHVSDISWSRVKHTKDVLQVGDPVKVKVLRFTPETGKMSLGLKQLADDPWEKAQERFAPGTKHKGKVVSMADYGAFIEIAPGVEGLLHISEMSWDRRLKHPSQMLALDAEVEVVVLQLDAQNRKLRLGLKQLTANPWADFISKNPIGTSLKGTVRSLTDFGAFVSLAEHIDGLLHISEFSWTVRFRSPSELLRKGEEVEAVLIKADPEQERLSLSLKQRYPDPWEKILQQYPVGRSVQVTVRRVLRPGLLVEVEPGVEGFVSWREIPDPASNQKGEAAKPKEEPRQEGAEGEVRHARDEAKAKLFKEGDSLTVQVIHVNPSEHKFRLSAKDIVSSEEKLNYVEYMAQNAAEQKEATSKLGELLKEALEKAPEEVEKKE